MSIQAITRQNPSASASSAIPVVAVSDFWASRSVERGFCGLSLEASTRLFLRTLAIVAVLGSTSTFGLWVTGGIGTPLALLLLSCGAGTAAGAFWRSNTLGDYKNPEELDHFQNEARGMTLDAIAQKHGWNNIFRAGILKPELFAIKYRQRLREEKDLSVIIDYYEKVMRHLSESPYARYEYSVPLPREWKSQWRQQAISKTFEELISLYPIEKLEKYNLLEAGELNQLRELKSSLDTARASLDRQVAQFEQEFQLATAEQMRTYQAACAQAEQSYNEQMHAFQRTCAQADPSYNSATEEEFQSYDLRYIRARQVVQEHINERKNEAKGVFDRAVAPFTRDGQIRIEDLHPAERGRCNGHLLTLRQAEARIDSEGQIEIAQVDARFSAEKERLVAEENRLKAERTQRLDTSKAAYDAAVAEPRAAKEGRAQPFNERFRSAVNDLNLHYRAYLRTLGLFH